MCKQRPLFAFLVMLAALLGAGTALSADQPAVSRTYYEALLEPIGNKVIHGMGQTHYQDYTAYAGALPETRLLSLCHGPAFVPTWPFLRPICETSWKRWGGPGDSAGGPGVYRR